MLALAFSQGAWAQQNQDALKKRKAEKLKSAFLKKAGWLTDYDKALAASKKTGNPVFAYFTRSFAP